MLILWSGEISYVRHSLAEWRVEFSFLVYSISKNALAGRWVAQLTGNLRGCRLRQGVAGTSLLPWGCSVHDGRGTVSNVYALVSWRVPPGIF